MYGTLIFIHSLIVIVNLMLFGSDYKDSDIPNHAKDAFSAALNEAVKKGEIEMFQGKSYYINSSYSLSSYDIQRGLCNVLDLCWIHSDERCRKCKSNKLLDSFEFFHDSF